MVRIELKKLSDPAVLSPKQRAAITAVIQAGGLLIFPTETFYALGGNALDEGLCRRISVLKQREPGKPFPLIANSPAAREKVVAEWPQAARELAKRFWPGPLTLILPGRNGLPEALSDERGGVALRHSPHPLLESLAAGIGLPLIATSANFSGMPPAARAEKLDSALVKRADLVITAPPPPAGRELAPAAIKPSTIVDCRSRPPRLVRAGALEIPGLT